MPADTDGERLAASLVERQEVRNHCPFEFVAVPSCFAVVQSFYAWNTRVICVITGDDICICYIDVTSSGRGLTAFPVVGG